MCVMVKQEVKQSSLPFKEEKSCSMSQRNCLSRRVTHSRSVSVSHSVCSALMIHRMVFLRIFSALVGKTSFPFFFFLPNSCKEKDTLVMTL